MQALKVGKKSLQVNCFFLSPCALGVAVCPVPQTLWVWACDPHSANRKEQSLKRSPPVKASCIGGGVTHTWLNVVLVNIFMGLRFTNKRKRMHWISYKIMTGWTLTEILLTAQRKTRMIGKKWRFHLKEFLGSGGLGSGLKFCGPLCHLWCQDLALHHRDHSYSTMDSLLLSDLCLPSG